MKKSKVMHIEQLKLLIISVYHSLEDSELINEVDKNTVEFVEDLIVSEENLNATDLLDTIEILKSEILKLEGGI